MKPEQRANVLACLKAMSDELTIPVSAKVRIGACMYVCVFVQMCVCVCVYVCV
jgi:tRNA-dihydrouridine synthase